jgi:hemerythrin-like domain-containing protein
MTAMEKLIFQLTVQHKEILAIISKMETEVGLSSDSKHAGQFLAFWEELSKILERHLLLEDDFLYPVLKKCEDTKVCEVAAQFFKELGNLKQAYTDYTDKWSSSDTIGKANSLFINESNELFDALKHRIFKEDTILFKLC